MQARRDIPARIATLDSRLRAEASGIPAIQRGQARCEGEHFPDPGERARG